MADELLGRLLGDLFDVHAALHAEHHQRLLGRAVEQHRGVVLRGDVRGVLDPERADDVPADVHPEDVRGVLAGLALVGCELDPAGLAAPLSRPPAPPPPPPPPPPPTPPPGLYRRPGSRSRPPLRWRRQRRLQPCPRTRSVRAGRTAACLGTPGGPFAARDSNAT